MTEPDKLEEKLTTHKEPFPFKGPWCSMPVAEVIEICEAHFREKYLEMLPNKRRKGCMKNLTYSDGWNDYEEMMRERISNE